MFIGNSLVLLLLCCSAVETSTASPVCKEPVEDNGGVAKEANADNDERATRKLISETKATPKVPPVCSLYLAPSLIPGSGLGIFTGIDLEEGDNVSTEDSEESWFQELLIPILDVYKTIPYRGHQRFLSWLGYVWPTEVDEFHHSMHDGAFPLLSEAFYRTPLGLNGADEGLYYFYNSNKTSGDEIGINVFAPGLASLVNSNFHWANVELLHDSITLEAETADDDDEEMVDPLSAARKSSFSRLAPGSGLVAQRNIVAGSELVMFYGREWHARHREILADQEENPNPNGFPEYPTLKEWLKEGFFEAASLPSEKDKRQKEKAMNVETASKQAKLDQIEAQRRQSVDEVLRKRKNKQEEESTQATEKKMQLSPRKLKEGDKQANKANVPPPVHEIQWLQENGFCLDRLHVAQSTIPGAGRGAFATHFVPRNTVLAPAPLLALKREDLTIYETDENSSKFQNTLNLNKVVGQELLLNYCYGDPKSELLLVPYSPVVNFINHHDDPSKINAAIRWPSRKTSQAFLQRSPCGWLDAHPLDVTDQSGQLLMEFVALKDIQPGEEIFLSYGSSWQAAWEEHKRTKEPGAAFRHEIGVPQGFFPSNWLNQLMEYEVASIDDLKPGEIRQLKWKHSGQPVARNAFVTGIPENFTSHMRDYAEERGILSLFEQLLAENVLDSDQWYVFDADQHNKDEPEQWFAQRYKSTDWDFNMHYVAAWNEAARKSYFQALGAGGFDQVLDTVGKYFELDTLTCFHSSFMGVSEADKSFMHTDVYATGEVGFNIIFPLITVDGSKPELDVQSDNADVVASVNYEHDRAFVFSDWGYHRTSAVDYEERGKIRVVMGMYCAQIDETNNEMIKHLYDGEDPAPFMDQFDLPIKEIHWDAKGAHRLPR